MTRKSHSKKSKSQPRSPQRSADIVSSPNSQTQLLSNYFYLERRYARSINLERDFDRPNTVLGYVLTDRATTALRRIVAAMQSQSSPDATPSVFAWTLTGVYGTGKSAFAHYLASLVASPCHPQQHYALEIAAETFGQDSVDYQTLTASLPAAGLFRAIATAQREPLRYTLIRALDRGLSEFSGQSPNPAIAKLAKTVTKWMTQINNNDDKITDQQVLAVIKTLNEATQTDGLIIIDELGKSLEFAIQQQGTTDLYLLQQLAELSPSQGNLYVVCLLHQAFADYGQGLSSLERQEWNKIQGRFEDIAFTESSDQMTRLMGQVIGTKSSPYLAMIQTNAQAWQDALQSSLNDVDLSMLVETYPLHPITSLALPMLCARYAQSDRSLFTFLTSDEPHSFQSFLRRTEIPAHPTCLPTLKLHHLYDYFVESVGIGMGNRPQMKRWVEIQGLISESQDTDSDALKLLKTIGILNLITSQGALRAMRSLVILALCDMPDKADAQTHWTTLCDRLLEQGVIIHRQQWDELRLWQGSDIDIDQEIANYIDQERTPLAELLDRVVPLKPIVAQRHSYHTGTLRYFERCYLHDQRQLEELTCTRHDSDGLLVYWLGNEALHQAPAQTQDGKPLVILEAEQFHLLRTRALDYLALSHLQTHLPDLQRDGVARREVRHRRVQAKRLLDDAFEQAFRLVGTAQSCWIEGEPIPLDNDTTLNTQLSELCDRIYAKSPILWNELINRRDLTSQGSKARRELIEAMLNHADQDGLGLTGYGPEVSMYYSLLNKSGIHRSVGDRWGFYPPTADEHQLELISSQTSDLNSIWQAMEDFCQQAIQQPKSIAQLYHHLENPPYGMKQGAIPILLAAFLLYHIDDVSVYKDGTFIPVLGIEHFELLVKAPERFSMKLIQVVGVRSQVFRELESVLRRHALQPTTSIRNITLLSVVKPLFQFVRRLPQYTLKTTRISASAQRVIQTLLNAQEPDELLFVSLPKACGLSSISANQTDNEAIAIQYRQTLVQILQEIQTTYETLLSDCQHLLQSAFGVNSSEEKLREHLRVRASRLSGQVIEPFLNRFVIAAVDETKSNQEWLEALIMIIADKPAESWTEGDRTRFELKLSDLAKRFHRIEALRIEMDSGDRNGFEARRITISKPDGHEVQRLIWLSPDQQEQVNPKIKEFVDSFNLNDPQMRDVFYSCLTEHLYGDSNPGENSETRSTTSIDTSKNPKSKSRRRQSR